MKTYEINYEECGRYKVNLTFSIHVTKEEDLEDAVNSWLVENLDTGDAYTEQTDSSYTNILTKIDDGSEEPKT